MTLDTLPKKSKASVTEFGIDVACVLAGSVVGYCHAQGVDVPQSAVSSAFLVPAGVQGVRYMVKGALDGAVVGGTIGAAHEWVLGGSYIESTELIKKGAFIGAASGIVSGSTVGAVLGSLEASLGYGIGYAAGSLQKMV